MSGIACSRSAVQQRICLLVFDEGVEARYATLRDGTLVVGPERVALRADEGELDAEGAATDGNYFYVDGPREAERVFRENLTGMLQTIATQAKVQVEFDPRRVSRWRLLGYENRDVADRDFRNDAVDAGEVGVGHQVTALYELKLVSEGHGDDDEDDAARLGTVHLRWEAPEHDTSHAGKVTEIERDITRAMFVKSEPDGSPHRRAQALAAEFAEILRGSYWAKESRLSSLVPVADALARELPRDQAVQDLSRMVRRAADLKEGQGARHREPLRDE